MAIWNDGAGNYGFGLVRFGMFNPIFPTISYLESDVTIGSLSSNLTALLIASGLQTNSVVSQVALDADNTLMTICRFAKAGDSINSRLSFRAERIYEAFNNPSQVYGMSNLYADNATTILARATNYAPPTNGLRSLSFSTNTTTHTSVYCCATATSSSLSLLLTQTRYSDGFVNIAFYHAGEFVEIPTGNLLYYNNNTIYKTILMARNDQTFASRLISSFAIRANHHMSATNKTPLNTGVADFTAICADAQTPVNPWASKFYLYEDTVLTIPSYPTMGVAQNMILVRGATDTDLLVPQSIGGSVFPGGNNLYVAIGKYTAGLTAMLRVKGV